jgi:membrane-bound ClpP family serine protease
MLFNLAYFVLRLALIVTIWAFIWRFVKPRTQLMRILRAALLVLGLLGALAVMRITCG